MSHSATLAIIMPLMCRLLEARGLDRSLVGMPVTPLADGPVTLCRPLRRVAAVALLKVARLARGSSRVLSG